MRMQEERTSMRTRMTISLVLMSALLPAALLGQATGTAPAGGTAGTTSTGGESAMENIETLVLEDFENATGWRGEMPRDQGIIFARLIPFDDKNTGYDKQVFGLSPLTWESINADDNRYPKMPRNEYCLGARVAHMRSGWNWFTLVPPRPQKARGVAKAFTVWVCGRGFQHALYGVVSDFYGTLLQFPFYTEEGHRPYMEFDGWRKMRMDVPANVRQREAHTSTERGIHFVGFRVECNPRETFGTFYMYVDQLETESDMYDENYRKSLQDMRDNW
jgi:hypothetical protein